MLMLTALAASVSADQNGNDRWCNIDNDGCWITGDNEEHWYIMFWTEPVRKFYMGDSTPPYTNVVDFPEGLVGRMSMEPAPSTDHSSGPSSKAIRIDPIIIDDNTGDNSSQGNPSGNNTGLTKEELVVAIAEKMGISPDDPSLRSLDEAALVYNYELLNK